MPDPVTAAESGSSGWRARAFSWGLSIALAAVLLYLSLRGVDWREVGHLLAGTRVGYLALGFVSTTGAVVLRALRWRLLLSSRHRFGFVDVFCANMVGYMGNNFLPARAGEVVRSVMLSRRSPLSKTFVLTTALVERLSDVIALVLFSSLALMSLHSPPAWLARASRTTAVAALAGAVALAVVPRMENLVQRGLAALPLPVKVRDRLTGLAAQILLGLRAFHHTGRFSGFCAFTVLIWFVDCVTALMIARSLALELSFSVALLLVSGLGLGSALPSTPGYVGIYQFVAVTVLAPFGTSRSDALAYILLLQALGYVVVTFWGLLGLGHYRAAGRSAAGRSAAGAKTAGA